MPTQSHTQPQMRYDLLFPILLIYAAILLLFGFCLDTPSGILLGLKKIVLNEDALITDYFHLAGPGAALVNSALVTATTVLTIRLSKEPFNGFSLVVVGLMSGFSLFGKNPVNSAPILLGTWLYAKSRKEPFGKYANVGLMSTALAPIVSYFALDNGWGDIPSAVLIGTFIGFVLPPLSTYTYRIQNGMNLYNMGFACGLLSMIIVPLIVSFEAEPNMYYRWATGYNGLFAPVLFCFCAGLILFGFSAFSKPVWAVWAGYRRLLLTSGRSPSDYLRMFGPAPVMVNMGINGMLSTSLILICGGDLNGPTIGGILTIIGFSAFGKHAFNILPVMIGVILGGLFMDWALDDSANQLAILFCTTLAPISGYFGWPYGILAGFLHSAVVRYTSSPVAGMNLYNNGFSGGLIAIFLYPTIIAIVRHRKPQLQNKDFFDAFVHDEPVVPPDIHMLIEEEDVPVPPDKGA